MNQTKTIEYFKKGFNKQLAKLDYKTKIQTIKLLKKALNELNKCYKAEIEIFQ